MTKPTPLNATPHAEKMVHWLSQWGMMPKLGKEFTLNALRAMIEDALIADRVARHTNNEPETNPTP